MAPANGKEALATPKLPPELWRPIMSSLTVHADRRTLCDVALASKLLGDEAQRVLFRATTDSFWRRNSLRRHMLYLSAIVNAATRLGPMVHIYSQINLATDPSRYPRPVSEEEPDTVKLWDLTMLALPAMTNLKHIQFSPRNVPSELSLKLLTQSTFNLVSLTWTPPQYDIDDVIAELLSAQEQLVHLDLSHFARPIPADVCPSLISIRATHGMWISLCLEGGRCIRALDVVTFVTAQDDVIEEDDEKQQALATCANNIRVLSCQSYDKLCLWFGAMPLRNLVLLRLVKCTVTNLLRISGFDTMRVLVIQVFDRESFSEGVVSSHLPSVFKQNSDVRYVDIQTEHRDVFQRYYKPTSDAMDQKPIVKLFRGNHATQFWWDSHVDEAGYTLNNASNGTLDHDEPSPASNMLSLRL